MPESEVLDIEGYEVHIHYDEDAQNPFTEFDCEPKLIMHEKARRHVDFGHDEEYGELLDRALERGRVSLDHTLKVFTRWVRTYHDVVAILPFSLLDHSGLHVYLGTEDHWTDPGGWDSAWVGFVLITRKQQAEWGTSDERLGLCLRSSFKEFQQYVSGEVFGYVVEHPDGHSIDDDSCWGFYGYDSYAELVESEFEIASGVLPAPGWRVKWRGEIRTVAEVETRLNHWRIRYEGDDVHRQVVMSGDTITLAMPGYMREAFMDVIERDRVEQASDAAEIDELRRAEVGV